MLRPSRSGRALFTALLAASAGACRYPATGVEVVVGTDAPPQRRLTLSVRSWRVSEPEATLRQEIAIHGGPSSSATLPFEGTFTIIPREGTARDARVQAVVEASLDRLGDQPSQVLRRAMRFTLTPSTPLFHRVFLNMACLNPSDDCRMASTEACTVQRACEERGETCGDDAQCVPVDVTLERRPDSGAPRADGSRIVGQSDARADALAPDSATPAMDAATAMDATAVTDAAMPMDAEPAMDAAATLDARADAAMDARADAAMDAADARTDAATDARADAAMDAADARADAADARADVADAAVDAGPPRLSMPGALAVGDGNDTCAADTVNRRIFCWGSDVSGRASLGVGTDQSSPLPSLATDQYVSMGLGRFHACMLTRNAMAQQRITCFGQSGSGECGLNMASVPGGNTLAGTTWTAVDAGQGFSCAIDGAGAVWCWGAAAVGQLGTGSTMNTPTPARVTGVGLPATAVEIGLGFGHACARYSNGEVWCWGQGTNGELGTGMSVSSTRAVRALVTNARSLGVGSGHACIVNTTNQVYCWGQGGALGDGTAMSRPTPVLVNLGGAAANVVAAGGGNTCVLTTANLVRCWGDNSYGTVGNGMVGGSVLSPGPAVAITGGANLVSVGFGHACARGVTGGMFCWGLNNTGQLGNGMISAMPATTPVRVSGT